MSPTVQLWKLAHEDFLQWLSSRSYYLALQDRTAPSPELLALHDWLLREA
ncbi:MAG: hypothetical protein WB783_04620 [Arenicellales bacterium]